MTISLPWKQQRHGNGPFMESSITLREMRALSELASMCPDQQVLEIGSAYGFSSIGMALSGATVTSVDHHQHMPTEQRMRDNLRAYGVADKVRMVVADSRTAIPSLPSQSFDGAFIDGDHSFDGCTFDVEQCLRLVKPGGWIAIHDYHEESCGEVATALDTLFGVRKDSHDIHGTNVHDRILIDTLYIVKVPYPRANPSSTLLTIATLHLPYRKTLLDKLKAEIAHQTGDHPIEHLIEEGPERYGVKMRRSLERASGQYVCWMDDDDWPMPDYVQSIMDAIHTSPQPDIITFGSYSPGCEPAWLRFGVRDDAGFVDGIRARGQIKSANHYCVWRRGIALSSPWLPRNYGAELAWYTALRHEYSNKLNEHHIPRLLHEYRYDANDTKCQDRPSIDDSIKNGGNRVLILRCKDGTGNGQLLMSVGWEKNPTAYKAHWPNGFVLSVPSKDVVVVDEIIYR